MLHVLDQGESSAVRPPNAYPPQPTDAGPGPPVHRTQVSLPHTGDGQLCVSAHHVGIRSQR